LRHRLKVTLHLIDLSSRHRQRVPDSDCWSWSFSELGFSATVCL